MNRKKTNSPGKVPTALAPEIATALNEIGAHYGFNHQLSRLAGEAGKLVLAASGYMNKRTEANLKKVIAAYGDVANVGDQIVFITDSPSEYMASRLENAQRELRSVNAYHKRVAKSRKKVQRDRKGVSR